MIPAPIAPKEETPQERNTRHKIYCKAAWYHITFLFISLFATWSPLNCRFALVLWCFGYFTLPWGSTMATAIKLAGFSLLKVGTGSTLLVCMWGALAFWQYSEDANAVSNSCTTAYNCILSNLNWGLRGDLKNSWGPPLITMFPEYISEDNAEMFEWLITTSWQIIWRFTFNGILTAIVVSAFGAARGVAAAKEADEKARCLICSIDRFTLEGKAGGFFPHKEKHHNPWMYLGYLTLLKLGDPDEFTGLESYVDKMVEANDMDFFPVGSCTDMEVQGDSKAVSKGPKNKPVLDMIGAKHKDLARQVKNNQNGITAGIERIEGMLKGMMKNLDIDPESASSSA